MRTSEKYRGTFFNICLLATMGILTLSGCTTNKYVGEQIRPVADRVSKTEASLSDLDGRVTANEDKISKITVDLQVVDQKAEQALAGFGNLKLERRLLVGMREGVHFAFDSAVLPDEAKQSIDGFISTLDDTGNAVFLIAGHTDSAGPQDINYELGKRRADAVNRYLIVQKKIDPLRVVTVSHGETSPIAANDTQEGRAKNRRVEVLVYSERITK